MTIEEVISELKECYALRANLKKRNLFVQEKLEDKINGLELSYISSLIIPKLEAYAKELLKDLECELFLSVQKDSNGEVSVTDEFATGEIPPIIAEETQIVEEPVVVEEPAEEEPYAEENDSDGEIDPVEEQSSFSYENDKQTKKNKARRLSIKFPDDEIVIAKKYASDTMVAAIRKIGVDRVSKVVEDKRMMADKMLIISKLSHPKYSKRQRHLGGGWLINTHSSTDEKALFLKKISKALHLNLKIELI